jgi:2-methylcitrate dehydratase PrpD
LQPDKVKSIRVSLGSNAVLPLVYDQPKSGLEGKFSLPFSAAVALIFRRAGLSEYTDRNIKHPKVTRLMKRVFLLRDRRLQSAGNLGCRAEVQIELENGRTYRKGATVAKGHPDKPLTRQELEEKFQQCAGDSIPLRAARKFIEDLWSIEKIDALARWLRLLRPIRR